MIIKLTQHIFSNISFELSPQKPFEISETHLNSPHRNLNLIDNMLKMMENYSNNLEVLVDERTTQLVEEKKKTDRLLYSLMPALVPMKWKIKVNYYINTLLIIY